jgi:16S rRNA (cytosine1402-N4)-methyltransferase
MDRGNNSLHIPVLVHEVVEGLAIAPDDIVLDCTVGSGGHSAALCQHLGPTGRLIGLDKDMDALRRATERLTPCPYPHALVQEDFRHLDQVLETLGITAVSKILFDLGMSSNQLEQSGRGFSFQRDEPLLMTFDDTVPAGALTAQHIVNTWREAALAEVLFSYGEERWARRIARTIVRARTQKVIATTGDLVAVIKQAVPSGRRDRRLHPATRTFQALRMAVNDELGALRAGLEHGFARLAPGGRMAVIAFHSLEDRIVKQFFRTMQAQQSATILTKKPLTPTLPEMRDNPRARSAKLRLLQRHETSMS